MESFDSVQMGESCTLRQYLVVDDVANNRSILKKMLVSEGVSIHEVADGEEALQMFLDYQYDAIFMDLQMPKMDGFQSVKEIRRIEAIENNRDHTPVIAVSGVFTESDDHLKARKCGFDAWLAKPINRQALKDILNRMHEYTGEVELKSGRSKLFNMLFRGR